jgi:indole-3-acetate monooxygenase
MAAGYASQMLGIGRAAIDTVVALTGTKVVADPGPALRERPAVLVEIARQAAAVEAARAHVRAAAAQLWNAATAGEVRSVDRITTMWGAALHAVDAARHAIEIMYAAAGTTSLYTDCPLERAHRDVNAMSRHIIAQDFWLEDAGRVRLGMSPTHPLYAL